MNKRGINIRYGRGCVILDDVDIGDYCVVGSLTVIEQHVKIGCRVVIQTLVNITSHTVIEDDCFISPCCSFLNDPFMAMGRLEDRLPFRKGPTLKKGCRIGGHATLLPGVVIGEGAVVGAGSVVTKDVPPHQLWFGHPARFIRMVGKDRP